MDFFVLTWQFVAYLLGKETSTADGSDFDQFQWVLNVPKMAAVAWYVIRTPYY